MKQGHLSSYFEGIAAKQLSAVEADRATSNQHEFNGVADLKVLLGSEKSRFEAKFLYLGDDENESVRDTGFVTWYDSRENNPKRSEYRLYYPTTAVSELAAEGDLLIIGRLPDSSVMVIVARAGSNVENKLRWLFSIEDARESNRFSVRDIEDDNDRELDFATRFVLAEIGVEIEETAEDYLEQMLEKFRGEFPPTREFSNFSRSTLKDVSSVENPDRALITWMDREELLFRTLERHLVSERVQQGFSSVDTFISFSLSVQNRRKSRVGYALENHLEEVFRENLIEYSRGKVTENRARPDFVFPGISYYRRSEFPSDKLTMLGVKSTCKERWRQVLAEADRIPTKHLLTLEGSISEHQTNEMKAHDLQLVLPSSIHKTYRHGQQQWLMDLQSFLALVRSKQALIL